MPFSIEEWRGYLAIDKMALDDEVVRQPSLFYEVSEAYAEAVVERDACKEQLAMTDAELDAEIRVKAGDEKITETAVKGRVQVSKKHKKSFDEYLAAKEYADKLDALKDAFKQRSSMLRDLASLFVANYFEESGLKGSYSSDKAVYETRRERLAAAREAKK